MKPELLDEILSCPSLPSLPSVAAKVVEMTANPNVKMDELAREIQMDQGLAAKVLRTVNSSFYGLRQRCATIQKALVLLGLSPVKTLTLGFSLVSCVGGKGKDDGFDYQSYWRRGLYTATAARLIAQEAKLAIGDEAFLAGLLQDIGMVAMHRGLKGKYREALQEAGADHRKLVRCELERFELQHPEIGAMLCQRWKLPDELVIPVKYHERATAAPKSNTDIVRVVALANVVHDSMTDTDPLPAARRVYELGQKWFRLDPERVDGLLRKVVAAVKELSDLFSLDVGAAPDAEKLISDAQNQMLELARQGIGDSGAPAGIESLVVNPGEIDPLTGAVGRAGFDSVMRKAFSASVGGQEVVSLVAVSVDGLWAAQSHLSTEQTDDLMLLVTTMLRKSFEHLGGVVCRLGGPLFAVVLVGSVPTDVSRSADAFRSDMTMAASTHSHLKNLKNVLPNIGVATANAAAGEVYATPAEMLKAAAQAVQVSRTQGGKVTSTASLRAAA